jgi:hypothetical protein
MYESFKVECPHCKFDDLAVIGATLVATGEKLEMHSPLSADGFEVPSTVDLKDCSTEDETVRCMSCNHEFPLADITL